MFNDGLNYQAALYLDAYNAASGLKYRNFSHVISENEPPYEPTWRMLAVEFLQIGRDHYQSDLKRYCYALKHGTFRGYDTAIVEPEAWMLNS